MSRHELLNYYFGHLFIYSSLRLPKSFAQSPAPHASWRQGYSRTVVFMLRHLAMDVGSKEWFGPHICCACVPYLFSGPYAACQCRRWRACWILSLSGRSVLCGWSFHLRDTSQCGAPFCSGPSWSSTDPRNRLTTLFLKQEGSIMYFIMCLLDWKW